MSSRRNHLLISFIVASLMTGCGGTTDQPADVIDEISEVQIVEVKDVVGDVPSTNTATAIIGPEGGELELGGASASIPLGPSIPMSRLR